MRVGAVRVFSKASAAIDRPRGKGREEHEEIQVIEKAHVLDDPVAHLDNHLNGLERDIGQPEKTHDIVLEHRPDLVYRQRSDHRRQGHPVLPQGLLTATPAAQHPERGRTCHRQKPEKRRHALGVLAEEQQQEPERCRQAVVPYPMPRKAQNGSGDHRQGEKHVERRVDIEVHNRQPRALDQGLAIDFAVHVQRKRLMEDDLLRDHVIGKHLTQFRLDLLPQLE